MTPSTLRRNNRGFTLTEMMIVVVIIGILAAIAVASYAKYTDNARQSQAEAFLAIIRGKQETYGSRYGRFLAAPPNPPENIQSGAKANWDPANARWLALGADPKTPAVGWQYTTGRCDGETATDPPPAFAFRAGITAQAGLNVCSGVGVGEIGWWATAQHDEMLLVTNSARTDAWIGISE